MPASSDVRPRTVADVVTELSEMVEVSRTSPTITQRLLGSTLTILYEFQGPEGGCEPYVLRIGGDDWSVRPGRIAPEQADIVIGTTPDTLHRLTNGELGGREAMVSGLLDIRKAPAMPKLLLMRALFNRHKKARQRGELPAMTDVEVLSDTCTVLPSTAPATPGQ